MAGGDLSGSQDRMYTMQYNEITLVIPCGNNLGQEPYTDWTANNARAIFIAGLRTADKEPERIIPVIFSCLFGWKQTCRSKNMSPYRDVFSVWALNLTIIHRTAP